MNNKKNVKPIRPPIPKALKEQVWLKHAGRKFEIKCPTKWCQNKITSFDFHVGHNIPFSKGGTSELSNLRPICSRCNTSMSDNYNFKTWDKIGALPPAPKEAVKKPIPQVLKQKPQVSIPSDPKPSVSIPPLDYYNSSKPKRVKKADPATSKLPFMPIIPNTIGNIYETKKENKLSKFISNILDKFI